MVDLLDQVPKIKSDVNFENLDNDLSKEEITVISRVNGLITLKEMGNGLGIPSQELTETVGTLLRKNLIYFDDAKVMKEFTAALREEEDAGDEDSDDRAEVDDAEETENVEEGADAAAGEDADRTFQDVSEAQGTGVKPVQTGNWNYNTIFSVIIGLHTNKATGLLRVHHKGGLYKSIYFDEGDMVQIFNHPFDPGQTLGRILQRSGRLSKEHVVESLKRKQRSGLKQGEELVNMGVVRRIALPELLNKQMEVKLKDLLTWGSGTWEFYMAPDLVKKIAQVEVSLPRLLFNVIFKNYDFVRRLDVNKQLKKKFIGMVNPTPFLVESFRLTENTENLLETLSDKDNPYQRLVIITKLNPDNLSKLLWTLHLCGMIVILDTPRISARDVRIKKLSERLRFINRESYFDIINIHWTRNSDEIKTAYQNSIKEQQDLVENSEGTERALREQLIQAMEKSYRTVKNKDTREIYRRQIYDESFIESSAELFSQKGESFLFTKDDFQAAIVEVENALEIWDKNPEYFCVLGLATFLHNYPRNSQGYSEGRRTLLKGYKDTKDAEISNICMGIMYREEKKNAQALEHLRKVLHINKKNRFAYILIQEIKSGKKQDDREEAIKQFLDQRVSEKEKKFNAKWEAARGKKK